MTGANESDTSAHLWDGWTDWAEDHHEFVGTQRRFGDRLEDKGYKRDREGDHRDASSALDSERFRSAPRTG